MRTSEAALALICRWNSLGQMEYLTQWNPKWRGYSLIGGHRDGTESFFECCCREIVEELELADDSAVNADSEPTATITFHEFSESAKEHTEYRWQIFNVQVQPTALRSIPTTCAWVSSEQVRVGIAPDNRPIANQVRRVLDVITLQAQNLKDRTHGQ